MSEIPKKQLIGSLTKGLIIMETLMEQDRVGVTELSKILDVNKSSAYRLLSTLEDRGFVEQVSANGKYRVGMKLAAFQTRVLGSMEINDIARSFLKKLTQETKETSGIGILSNGVGIVIDKQNSQEIISANLEIGMSEPLHCTALGKVLLSGLPESERIILLRSQDIQEFTPKTITDIHQILEEIRRTEIKGIAVDDEEHSLGMRCIAAPVRNAAGEIIAAIGISGPLMRIRTDKLAGYMDTVKKTAQELSAKMGYNHIVAQ